ncbi:MAG TPA: hypothetical protein VFP50_16690, partial [Anaeromyxobacteraceae bacterium]|nr:hypothetical protein [Anaeromyxobacteraceae bacterium]
MQRSAALDAFRFLVPLLGLLALVAWAASWVVNDQARTWAERDLAIRARLVARGARESLAARLASGDGPGARALLDDLARDERLMGAALCRVDGRPVTATATLPEQASCARLPPHLRGEPLDAP